MKRIQALTLLALLLVFFLQPAGAQQNTGVIDGRTSDTSGALIPGVAVTLTSAAVMGARQAVTDERGAYRFTLLPPGTYKLQFELSGFATMIRENIQLTGGFTATVNVEMQVATLSDTITVTGQSPVVDLESAMVAVNFTQDLLRNIPNGRDQWAALAATPGVQMTRHDVGSYGSGSQSTYRTYGSTGQYITQVDGVIINDGNASTGIYLDYGSFEEVQVVAASKGAQIQVAGAALNLTVKSGSNHVHGMFYQSYSNKSFQSNNLTPEVAARGFNGVNGQDLYHDTNANLGGPFVRDKFWWFTSWRHTYNRIQNPLFFQGGCNTPDPCLDKPLGTFPFADTPTVKAVPYISLDNITLKFNFQLSPNNQLSYTGQMSNKRAPWYGAIGSTTPETARYFTTDSVASQHYPGWYQTWKWVSTLSPRATLDMSMNNFNFVWTQGRRVNEYSRRDLDTLQVRGGFSGASSGGSASSPFVERSRRLHYNVNLALTTNNFLTGTHNIAAGGIYNYQTDTNSNIGTVGNFVLFYRGGFKTPTFIDTWDTPYRSQNGLRKTGIFVNDRWNVTQKLTLNLGLREDIATPFYPDQSKDGTGPFQPKQTITGYTLPTMNHLAPRFSFIYDVLGDGKTALKGGFARYTFDPAEGLAGQANPIAQKTTRYNWDGVLPFDPAGKTVVSTSSGANRSVDPDLKLPYTDEYTAGMDQQLMSDFALRLNFVRKLEYNSFQSYNTAIPFSAYNIPVSGVDPGLDGVAGTADDTTLLLYSLDPAYVGRNVGLYKNNSGIENNYTTLEASVVKRLSKKWQMLTGWDYVHRSTTGGTPQDPNSLRYRNQSHYWTWTYKVLGSYEAPGRITLSSEFRSSKGEPYGRSVNSPRLNQGILTVQVDPSGTYFNDTVRVLDFRAEKTFMLHERWGKVSTGVDLFNIFNSDAVTSVSSQTGAAFGSPSATITPRIFRLGMRYEF